MKNIYSLYSAFLSILFMFLADSLKAQEIAINEIMASNNTVIVDDDGDYSDWIETIITALPPSICKDLP